MHDAQRTGQPLILQVQIERLELRRGQHALVDHGLAGKAWEVDGFTAGAVLARALGTELVLGTLADHVGAALQLHAVGAGDEHLAEGWHRVAGQRAQRRVVGGYLAPAQYLQALGFGDLLDRSAGGGRFFRRLRQERDAGGVTARLRQVEVDDVAQERIGNLDQDAGTVTAVRLGALGAAVLEVHQRGDCLIHDVAAAAAVHVDDHGHPARVMLECGVVEPDAVGRHSHLTLHQYFPPQHSRIAPLAAAPRGLRARPLRSCRCAARLVPRSGWGGSVRR